MRAAFLVLLLWAVACAHPVPGHQPAHSHHRAHQEDTASEDYITNLGNPVGGGDGRHPPVSAERGDNALAGDLVGRNTVGEELGEQGGPDKGDRIGETRHLNRVDHEDTSARDGNGLGFLEEDAGDAGHGDDGEYHGTGVNGLPSHADGLLDEEDDSGDDTFDENGGEEGGEGPTYMAGADGAGEHGQDVSGVDAGAGGGHGDDSSSSSSSESAGADHQRHRNYLGSRYERTYRWGGGSSSSQEDEESYNFEDEAMQGDDPSVFDSPSSSYKAHRAGPRAPGSSRESVVGAGSHGWEEDDDRSPEVEGTDSGEDSPSIEDNSQSEEAVASRSEENSASPSREDGEDSPSREDEDSKSSEGITDQSDEEPSESPEDISQEVVSTSSERSSRSWERQEDQEIAEDRSAISVPGSESGEDEGDHSKSIEDTVEESKENENDSNPDGHVLSSSDESQSVSSEDDGSQEDNTGEDSRSPESDNSESQEEDDDEEESHSQEDATHESSSRGDDSSLQSLESGSHKRRVGAHRNKPADYDDNDCQDGY